MPNRIIGVQKLHNATIQHVLVSFLNEETVVLILVVLVESGIMCCQTVDVSISNGFLVLELSIKFFRGCEVRAE